MAHRIWLAVLVFGVAAAISAQQFQVGFLPGSPDVPIASPDPPQATVFDMAAGSPATGYLTSATFAYSAFPCPAAVRIVVLRAGTVRITLFTVLGVDGRGPFDVTQRIQTVALVPPLKIQQGDWIGLSSNTNCGHPLATAGPGKVSVANSIFPICCLPQVSDGTLYLQAQGTRAVFADVSGTIPVVFTGDGAAGSHFRTEVLLLNPSANLISGSLTFVPSSPSPQVPDKTYSLGPFEVQSVELPGFGSIDIKPATLPGPSASVRVFNDAGAAGTMGFAESDIPPEQALAPGETGVLVGPADPVTFRFNIGIRSLDIPASGLFTARSSDGTPIASVTRSGLLGLKQMTFQELFGIPLDRQVSIHIQVAAGNVIIYGVAADNRTNDSSFQLAKRVPKPEM